LPGITGKLPPKSVRYGTADNDTRQALTRQNRREPSITMKLP